ncbi:hypothetical protein [Streptomyces shenzhenensis]|uniref:Uncharacterized protein n=1 Tax=Streptomyces shenzhenensis TaxID=943815 RepID=A0A3M0I0N0_9ACTN|nr:hypothetical protein [Streptomyces shenzhenensis]RMB81712.1 hypothetical protein CTZ28_33200 [Streptomyces shenzhenensis]
MIGAGAQAADASCTARVPVSAAEVVRAPPPRPGRRPAGTVPHQPDSDGPGGRELAVGLLDAAPLVVDDRELAALYGVLAASRLPLTAADGALGGLPWQDMAPPPA